MDQEVEKLQGRRPTWAGMAGEGQNLRQDKKVKTLMTDTFGSLGRQLSSIQKKMVIIVHQITE